MAVLFIVIPLAIILAAAALAAFILAARRGQFEDLDTPPLRVIHDDDADPPLRPTTHPAHTTIIPGGSFHTDQ